MDALPQYPAPNLMFSHLGFTVSDLDKMVDFYTRILGFTVTDRGNLGELTLVFLSRDPMDHHQLALVTGKPENIPLNPIDPGLPPVINQISFRVGNLQDLKALHKVLLAENIEIKLVGSHGVSWSIYCLDPDGNMIELFVDTEWYFPQPFLVPLDLTKSNEEIYAETEKMCREQPGFEPYANWRAKISGKMNIYRPRYAPIDTLPAGN